MNASAFVLDAVSIRCHQMAYTADDGRIMHNQPLTVHAVPLTHDCSVRKFKRDCVIHIDA